MQTFKKVLAAILCFAALLTLLSVVILVPYSRSESNYNQDSKLRSQLAGTIDYIFIGASHGLVTFIPEAADNELNCVSYNLSESMLPMYSRYYLLRKELDRNPVKTVVLELSCDTLSRNAAKEYGIGEDATIDRLDSFSERAEYLLKYTAYDDWLNVYSRQLTSGISYWKKRVLGNLECEVDYAAKGFYGREPSDVSLSSEEIIREYNKSRQPDSFKSEEKAKFQDVVDLCKSYGCRVIVVVVPVPDSYIWERDNLDAFTRNAVEFCDENNIEFYDFNLVRDRYEIYSDQYSFSDGDHMSTTGAEAFMKSYITIMKSVDANEDISCMFYDSYSDLKEDSPYMRYYKSTVK